MTAAVDMVTTRYVHVIPDEMTHKHNYYTSSHCKLFNNRQTLDLDNFLISKCSDYILRCHFFFMSHRKWWLKYMLSFCRISVNGEFKDSVGRTWIGECSI